MSGQEGIGMYHPGFASAWLSKSPTDDLDAYTGDGDWFKILVVTGRTEQSLDYSNPENEKHYDTYKSPWGTFRLTSVSCPVLEAFRVSPVLEPGLIPLLLSVT